MTMRNPIWEFSLELYRREGVAEQCLRAQNELDADVNVLLYAAWLASTDQRLSFAHLEGLDKAVGEWRARVVQPLRILRQSWREYAEAAAIRDAVKDLELRAEEQQQNRIWQYYLLAPALASVPRPLEENLALVFESMGCDRELWSPMSQALLAVLARGG